MKILLWHGYLLGGTGSNVYTRMLARQWSGAGHEVVVFSQEPHPERFDLEGATVVRPQLPGPLPVFVLDRYEDLEARFLQDFSREERDAYVEANAAAVREHLPADLLLVNHVLPGGPVGVAAGSPFSVKAHGSELEFSIRGNCRARRVGPREPRPGRGGLRGLGAHPPVLGEVVGAGWTYTDARARSSRPASTWTSSGPSRARRRSPGSSRRRGRDPPNPGRAHERLPDPGNAERLAEFLAGDRPDGRLRRKAELREGRRPSPGCASRRRRPGGLGRASGRSGTSWKTRTAGRRVLFTGPLEHRHLRHLWALADVSVTPSVFPEAFGMVAAEAAACGSPPLVARHSGPRRDRSRDRGGVPARASRPRRASQPDDAADLAAKLQRPPRAPARRAPCARRRGPSCRRPSAGAGSAWRLCYFRAMGEAQRLSPDEQIRAAREAFEDGKDFTVAVEEEFAVLDPDDARARQPLRGAPGRCAAEPSSKSTSSAS